MEHNFIYNQPVSSDWYCRLFGCGEGLVINPVAGKVPNKFWRIMQFLLIGNEWYKKDNKDA